MKKLLLILLFQSCHVYANFVPIGTIDPNSYTVYTAKRHCEAAHHGVECIKLPEGWNPRYYEFKEGKWVENEKMKKDLDKKEDEENKEREDCVKLVHGEKRMTVAQLKDCMKWILRQ